MEEISHAFDGGIYAELIQNRSFEEGVLPPGMKLVTKPNGSLKLEFEKLPPGVPPDKWDMPWPWHNNCAWQPDRALIGWSLGPRGCATGEMRVTDANPMNAASSRSLGLKVGAAADPNGGMALINSGYWGINVRSGTPYGFKCYLMMLERNGDLIKMASYAPLFVNVNQSNWGVNLIEFGSARSYVHAS